MYSVLPFLAFDGGADGAVDFPAGVFDLVEDFVEDFFGLFGGEDASWVLARSLS